MELKTDEPIAPKEKENNSLFDAVLVHGYWFSQKGETASVRLSLRSRLATRAAAALYDGGRGSMHIVLTGGHIWGEHYPSLGKLMQKDLIDKYHIPQEAIVVEDNARGTSGEIDIFLDLAKKHGWKKLADLSADQHTRRIKDIYDGKGEEIKIKSVEKILSKDDPHVQRLVKNLGASIYAWNYRLYEGTSRLTAFLNMPFINRKLKPSRNEKGEFALGGPLRKLPVDKYNL